MVLKTALFGTLLIIAGFVLNACKQGTSTQVSAPKNIVSPAIQRFGSVTGLKPEKLEYYKKLHANAWSGVLKEIHLCHISNYSIFLQKIGDKYFLFSYFEYTGDNFNADMKKMSSDSITKKWWKETDPCQLPLPEAIHKKAVWTNMEQVFHEK